MQSTSLRDASSIGRTLPRPKNMPPACFLNGLSSPILSIKKSRYPKGYLDFLVREMGLEPTRRNHTHLKRACLPFQHSRERLNIIQWAPGFVNILSPPYFYKTTPLPLIFTHNYGIVYAEQFLKANKSQSGCMVLARSDKAITNAPLNAYKGRVI